VVPFSAQYTKKFSSTSKPKELDETYFDHVSTKKDLITKMKSYSEQKELPLEFGADASQVMNGTKKLLQDTDLFDFKCTGTSSSQISVTHVRMWCMLQELPKFSHP
jgi:hypothetical protein